MLGLEDWMDIRSLHQQGLTVSEIARQVRMDRKTMKKYLREVPRAYRRKPKALRERLSGFAPPSQTETSILPIETAEHFKSEARAAEDRPRWAVTTVP